MRLYTFTITPNNRKVEAFVRHFDLPVEIHHVSFKDRETQSPGYLAINPMARVPALVDGDFKLWESNAILTYLATMFPQTKALPTDPRGRADADRWLHWQSCHLMPAMGALKVSDEKDISAVTPLLRVLDQQLQGREYVLGQSVRRGLRDLRLPDHEDGPEARLLRVPQRRRMARPHGESQGIRRDPGEDAAGRGVG